MEIKRGQGRLGWSGFGAKALYLAVALFFFSSHTAWSLDLDSEIAKSDAEAARISGTLGRSHGTINTTRASASTERMVGLKLIKKAPKKNHFAHKKAPKSAHKVARHKHKPAGKKSALRASKRRHKRA